MKSHTLSSEKMPFYQKVLNLTLGFGTSPSRHVVTGDDSPVAASPFRRGYSRHSAHPVASPLVAVSTPTAIGTPVKSSSSASSTAASIFRSFRRRSLRRSFRRTKSFLVKNPTGSRQKGFFFFFFFCWFLWAYSILSGCRWYQHCH